MELINWNAITAPTTRGDRIRAAKREMARVPYISLSDCLVYRRQGGQYVIEELEKEEKEGMVNDLGYKDVTKKRTWKIKLLRNEWGDPPVPGTVYEIKRIKVLRDEAGNKLGGRYINDLNRQGRGRERYDISGHLIDKDGCIECSYSDASYLLCDFGIHYANKAPDGKPVPITGKKELSGGPCKAPDGSYKHTWNWRCVEVPPDFANLETPSAPHKAPRRSRSKDNERTRIGSDVTGGIDPGNVGYSNDSI